MSTQPVTSGSYNNANNGYNLSSLNNNSQLQVTGLASGLNTNAIIQALVSIDQQPITNLTNQQNGLTATNKQLTSIQTALQQLVANAQALASPSLFANAQTVTSNNSAVVTATANAGQGAVVGGYSVAVQSLATAAQKTFNFSSPSQADTVTIDNTPVQIAAGASAQDLVNAVNSSTADVWATVTSPGAPAANGNPATPATIVFSSRSTGQLSGNWMSISDSQGSLSDASTQSNNLDINGTDAQYTINNKPGSSPSNTVTNAIPGVTLTLNNTTAVSGPVGVAVSPPGPNTQSIQTAVQTFITSYNSVVTQIQTQLSQAPSSSDPTQGTLYGDPALQGLLTSMRQAMYATVGNLGSGASITSMLNIGVSTGAASGNSLPSQNSISGQLTLDATALTNALQTNSSGVLQMLKGWSQSFSTVVNAQAAPGGAIDSRIQSDNSRVSQLGSQIAAMQQNLNDKQTQLQQQFAAMEAALSQNQSTSAWLTSQINSLP
jgi:flagellar hook-associated protein 2